MDEPTPDSYSYKWLQSELRTNAKIIGEQEDELIELRAQLGQRTQERDALQSTLDELSTLYANLDERYGRLQAGLRFYANGRHMAFAPEAAMEWEDVSGEPPNWLQRNDSDHYEMVEDGTIAKMVLRGEDQNWSEHDDGEPPPIEGEILPTKHSAQLVRNCPARTSDDLHKPHHAMPKARWVPAQEAVLADTNGPEYPYVLAYSDAWPSPKVLVGKYDAFEYYDDGRSLFVPAGESIEEAKSRLPPDYLAAVTLPGKDEGRKEASFGPLIQHEDPITGEILYLHRDDPRPMPSEPVPGKGSNDGG